MAPFAYFVVHDETVGRHGNTLLARLGGGAPAAASFIHGIPALLGVGMMELADGSWVTGFLCESYAVADGASEITEQGAWRAYIQSQKGTP